MGHFVDYLLSVCCEWCCRLFGQLLEAFGASLICTRTPSLLGMIFIHLFGFVVTDEILPWRLLLPPFLPPQPPCRAMSAPKIKPGSNLCLSNIQTWWPSWHTCLIRFTIANHRAPLTCQARPWHVGIWGSPTSPTAPIKLGLVHYCQPWCSFDPSSQTLACGDLGCHPPLPTAGSLWPVKPDLGTQGFGAHQHHPLHPLSQAQSTIANHSAPLTCQARPWHTSAN